MGCNGALASVCEALGSVPPFQTQGRKKPSGYAAHICSNQVLVNPTTSTEVLPRSREAGRNIGEERGRVEHTSMNKQGTIWAFWPLPSVVPGVVPVGARQRTDRHWGDTSGDSNEKDLTLLLPVMWCALPCSCQGQRWEWGWLREGKRPWQQKVRTPRAALGKERGADGRSLWAWGASMALYVLWVCNIPADTGAENMRWRHRKKSTRGAEASVMRQIPGLIS